MYKEFKFIIPVKPRTKKNHSQLVTLKTGRQMLLPSKAYAEFEKEIKNWFKSALKEIQDIYIDYPVNLKCIFYKDRAYKSDLSGYLQAIQDALVKIGMFEDDNHYIIESVDGSKVYLDREFPRIEVTITQTGEKINEADIKKIRKAA